MRRYYIKNMFIFLVCSVSFKVQAAASAVTPAHEVEVTLGVISPLIGAKGMDKFFIELPNGQMYDLSIAPGAIAKHGVGQRFRLGKIDTSTFGNNSLNFYFTNAYHPEDKTFFTRCSMRNISLEKDGKPITKVRININDADGKFKCSFEAIY